jgi:hypothetical protein
MPRGDWIKNVSKTIPENEQIVLVRLRSLKSCFDIREYRFAQCIEV